MRLVSAFLFVALTGSGALADEPKPADPKPEVMRHKVPFRVVKMLPETGQVLLFDRDRGSHVVAEVGQTVDGYRVDDLDDETVTLVAESGTQIILAAPPPRLTHRSRTRTPASEEAGGDDDAIASTTAPASAAPAAGSSGQGPGMPVDPYAEPAPPTRPGEGGVRVASAAAPATALVADDPYADPGIAAFADAVGATPTPTDPAPYPARSEGATGPAPRVVTATAPAATSTSPGTAAATSSSPGTAAISSFPGATAVSSSPGTAAISSTPGATSTTPGTAAISSSPGTAAISSTPGATSTTPGATATTSATTSSSTAGTTSPSGVSAVPVDDTGAALASALTGAPAPSTTATPSRAPVAPPPPDLASLDVDEPAATSTTATSTAATSHAATSPATAATSHASPSPATATATSSATATLARGELDAALADFSTLAASFRATFTPAGLRFDTLRDGTLLTRIGLRKGDVITSIDGQPLRSLDDAANLYARASSLRAATIQVTRAGQPITLRVAIR